MMDLQTGNVIVFNGEIYNHLALRKQIDQIERCSWNGSSDTETLLAAYRVWSEGMFERLKGMFAFAIYDARQRSLLLARDRLGIKPLYYKATDGGFQAASEVRALSPLSRARPLPTALASYLRFGASTDDNPLLGEARVLPAGHWMTVSVETGDRHLGCYWPSHRPFRSVHPDPARQVRTLLENAVEEHLLADVPVASFLSGGIDSSVITALAARRMGGKLQTFSVVFRKPRSMKLRWRSAWPDAAERNIRESNWAKRKPSPWWARRFRRWMFPQLTRSIHTSFRRRWRNTESRSHSRVSAEMSFLAVTRVFVTFRESSGWRAVP